MRVCKTIERERRRYESSEERAQRRASSAQRAREEHQAERATTEQNQDIGSVTRLLLESSQQQVPGTAASAPSLISVHESGLQANVELGQQSTGVSAVSGVSASVHQMVWREEIHKTSNSKLFQ